MKLIRKMHHGPPEDTAPSRANGDFIETQQGAQASFQRQVCR